MNRRSIPFLLAVCVLGPMVSPNPALLAQGGGRYLALGLSGGAGLVQTSRLNDAWKVGPFFGGRFEWSMGQSAAWMVVDVQPFRAERTSEAGDFRAVYIVPTYSVGSESSRIAIGAGVGFFDFRSELREDGTEVGFVFGASGAYVLSPSRSIELGWKRIRDVQGLRANAFSLQLVQGWRF